jgi:beta-lactamase regulating signal transducer with metallopeptidase domain
MDSLIEFWRGLLLHLWQTTIVFAVLFGFDRLLRRAPARMNHALWSVALVKLFLPLSVFGALTGYVALAGSGFDDRSFVYQTMSFLQPVLTPADGMDTGTAAEPVLGVVLILVTALWIAVFFRSIRRIVADAMTLSRYSRRDCRPPAETTEGNLLSILEQNRIPADRVLVTGGDVMPSVVGLWKPQILLPERLLSTLSDQELRAVVIHEDAHRRRRDPLRTLVYRMSTAVFFFYPPVHIVIRRLQSTAEFACDDRVVECDVPTEVYTRAMATTLRMGLAIPAAGAAAAGFGGSFLRRRLARLKSMKNGRNKMIPLHRILILLAVAIVAVSSFYPAPPALVAAEEEETEHKESGFPETLKMVRPHYPDLAYELAVEATVMMKVKIDTDGSVSHVEAINCAVFFTDKTDKARFEEKREELSKEIIKQAKLALYRWKFARTAEPTEARVPIEFKLNTDCK